MIRLSLALSALLLATTSLHATIKVACVGDSITYGAMIPSREILNYPAQLGYLLGDDYEVQKFGVNGATMLNKGDLPYIDQFAYKPSKAFNPDIVIITLGTNDSKPHNWQFKADFVENAKSLIRSYESLQSRPRVVLCQPVIVTSNGGITEAITRGEVAPLIRQVAYETGTELIDLHTALIEKKYWLPDGVHHNAFGAETLARTLHRYLSTERDESLKFRKLNGSTMVDFYGYEMHDFQYQGAACKIVSPKEPATGSPWIWRARFWGHEPQFDIAMLELGWHVVYCDVSDLFGAPVAVERWDQFYTALQSYGLAKKPVLEGMSRGGLIIHNWAIANPEKVAGIIADNAVMDFKSWPAGFGSSKGASDPWQLCKNAYNFNDDAEAKAYTLNPVDTVEELKSAGIPLLYIIGDADAIVPPAENGFIARDKLKDAATYIIKSGKGHHPHALPDPASLIDFALKCNDTYINPAALAAPSAEYRSGAGWGGGIWWDQHNNISKIAQENPDLELIFFGDSITQSWTGPHKRVAKKDGNRVIDKHFGSQWKTASFGISGDRTEHLIYRAQNGNFDGLKPKAVVVMIGVNNLLAAQHSADQITGGIEALIETLTKKLPDSKIIFLGPFPSGNDPQESRRLTIAQIQKNIAPLGDKKNVTYIDLAPAFLNADGTLKAGAYSGDAIHLKNEGYEIWATELKPHLLELIQ